MTVLEFYFKRVAVLYLRTRLTSARPAFGTKFYCFQNDLSNCAVANAVFFNTRTFKGIACLQSLLFSLYDRRCRVVGMFAVVTTLCIADDRLTDCDESLENIVKTAFIKKKGPFHIIDAYAIKDDARKIVYIYIFIYICIRVSQ